MQTQSECNDVDGTYGGQAPFVAGSDTSEKAAGETEPFRLSLSARVLKVIKSSGGHGATDDEIEVKLMLRHQTASARRRELVLSGAIRDSGERRKTRSGRTATVWKFIKPHPWKNAHTYPNRKGNGHG